MRKPIYSWGNQYIVEETDGSKPIYSWGNQYIVEETDVSKPIYSWGNQIIFEEPNVYSNKPVYKGANPYTLDQTDVSKPVYVWLYQCIINQCVCHWTIHSTSKPIHIHTIHMNYFLNGFPYCHCFLCLLDTDNGMKACSYRLMSDWCWCIKCVA